jgi:curved DNA-binding protein CbpA
VRAATLYDELGVAADADAPTLHRAYRRLAKRFHPDRCGDGGARMVALNAAWAVLSDPDRRAAYDTTLAAPIPPPAASTAGGTTAATNDFGTAAPPGPRVSRKEAWLTGVRMQTARLTAEAGRSTALALALRRRGRPRAVYDAQIDAIVAFVADRPQERTQAARLAGAAPLDLGLAAALVGLQAFARRLQGRAVTGRWTEAERVQAEMVDRMWDTLAHGVPHELALALGGNPHLARRSAV